MANGKKCPIWIGVIIIAAEVIYNVFCKKK